MLVVPLDGGRGGPGELAARLHGRLASPPLVQRRQHRVARRGCERAARLSQHPRPGARASSPPGGRRRPRRHSGNLSELGRPQSDTLGPQDHGVALRRFITPSGEEPRDAGRRVSGISAGPELGGGRGEAAGGALARACWRARLRLRCCALGPWQPHPVLSPPRRGPSQAARGALLFPRGSPAPALRTAPCASLAEPSGTASPARFSPGSTGRARSSVGPPLTSRNPPTRRGARRAVGSAFHSLLKHSARVEAAPRSASPDG
ncbi:unnamed protein product [Rangifer tarandus platyrhynchus]|uniref:Uncharacterized protein n=1 Tax=Rangifer tarandus platyrhynchus TaxID=3082113 RepID=A0AC59Z1T9_RANTA